MVAEYSLVDLSKLELDSLRFFEPEAVDAVHWWFAKALSEKLISTPFWSNP